MITGFKDYLAKRRLNPPMQLFSAKEQKIIFLDNQNSIFLWVFY